MKSRGESQLLELVRLAYAAAGEPARWRSFLVRYAQVMSGSDVWLLMWNPRTQESSIAATVGPTADDAVAHDYNAYYSRINPLMRNGTGHMRAGAITLSHAKYPIDQLLRSEFYSDFAKKLDLAYTHAVCLSSTAGEQAHISCIRSLRAGPYGRDDVRFVRPLVSHLQCSLQIHQLLGGVRLGHTTEADALDRVAASVFVVAPDGRVLLSNAAAERLLALRDGLALASNGLRAAYAAETRALRAMITRAAGCAAGKSVHAGGRMWISRPSVRSPLLVTVVPTKPALVYPQLPYGCVTVFVHDPEDALVEDELVARLYGLTSKEAKLAVMILQGRTLAAIGDRLAITRETARTHFKAILKKSGTSRQSEFVRSTLKRLAGQLSGRRHSIERTH